MPVHSHDVSIELQLVVGKYWWYSGRPHNIWQCTALLNGEYAFEERGGKPLKVKKKKFDQDFQNHAWEEKWKETWEQWEQPQRRPPPASPPCQIQ